MGHTSMSVMVKFRCENCGQLLSIAPMHTGGRGRCPRCKKLVTIPEPRMETATSERTTPEMAPCRPLGDRLLFDLPPAAVAPGESHESEAAQRRQRELQAGYVLQDHREPPPRKLPWPIDICLYPLSKAGLTILFLSTGVPFLLRLVLRFFAYGTGAFPPMLIFWVLFIVLHYAALLLFLLYLTWYLCECLRDSAAGGLRAADTTANTPGLGELLGQCLVVAAAAGVCLAPALVYFNSARSANVPFWTLFAVGGFVLPMALLAVVMFESLRALNPLLLLGSIFSTFFPYCLLVPFCYGLCLLVPVATRCLFSEFWILSYVLIFLAFYQWLVLAHLLGRFYWRNRQRLNWDT